MPFGRCLRTARETEAERESSNLAHGVVVRARPPLRRGDDRRDGGRRRGPPAHVRGARRLLQERGRYAGGGGRPRWVRPEGANKGLIERIDERHSVLSRQHPGESQPAEDVILANPDQALVVFAA
ncbi:MAG: hypothetical protein H6639_16375 [Caldilineaceae bacterium]|nr:hypothetical protein [Caldilineaceae bacterium]